MLEKERLEEIVRSHATVSGKIRALAAAGTPRADIARLLNKRYQHVRNVLEEDARRTRGADPASRLPPSPSAHPPPTDHFRLEVDAEGRVTLPPQALELLDVKNTPVVMARIEGGEVRLVGAHEAVRRVQARLRASLANGADLADELIADRREEVRREERHV